MLSTDRFLRLTYLHLRSRQAGRALVLLAVLAATTLLWRWFSDGNPLDNDLMITGLPVAAAVIIGASTHSPFRDIEDTAPVHLSALRFPHLFGLLIMAACGMVLATVAWHVSDIGWDLVRNVAIFTGLALIACRIIGSGFAWIAPMGYGIAAFIATLMWANQPGHQLHWAQSGVRWAWTLHAGSEHEAAMVAGVVLAAGLALVICQGVSDSAGET